MLNMSQNTKESTGVLLNRMAPEIVQVAKQRLEALARNDAPSDRGKLRFSRHLQQVTDTSSCMIEKRPGMF